MADPDLVNMIRGNALRPGRKLAGSVGFRIPTISEMLNEQDNEESPVPADSRTIASRGIGTLNDAEIDEEGNNLNFLNVLGEILDIAGRPVRDLVGAGTAAIAGDFETAGRRLKDVALAVPDIATLGLADLRSKEGTTGSELLDDLGWKSGTTAEDERRIRVAVKAGMSHAEARKKFGSYGDRLLKGEVAEQFEALVQQVKTADPDFDINQTWADTKHAIDAQDFGGLAVEILLDPITYLTGGLSAAGKAAKAALVLRKTAPKLYHELLDVGTTKGAKELLSKATPGTTAKQRERLLGLIEKTADKDGKVSSLFLSDSWSAQAREGNRAALVMPGGKPLFKGQALFDFLSHIGQTKVKEKIDPQLAGMDRWFFDLKPVKYAVGGLKGFMQFMQEKVRRTTGISALDELMATRDADAMIHVTQMNRELDRHEGVIRQVAKDTGNDINDVRAMVAETVELSKRLTAAQDLPTNPIDLIPFTDATRTPRAAEFIRTMDPNDPDAALQLQTLLKAELPRVSDFRSASNAADLSAAMSGAWKNLGDAQRQDVANIAKGIVSINQRVVDTANGIPVKLTELNDDTIQYLHHRLTPQARDNFQKLKESTKTKKFFEQYGLEFNARSKTFLAREESYRGKTLSEINAEWRKTHDFDLFDKDPIVATREAVRSGMRATANAKFVAGLIEEYSFQSSDKLDEFLDALQDAKVNKVTREELRLGRAIERAEKAREAAESVKAAKGTLRGGLRGVERSLDRAETVAQTGRVGVKAEEGLADARGTARDLFEDGADATGDVNKANAALKEAATQDVSKAHTALKALKQEQQELRDKAARWVEEADETTVRYSGSSSAEFRYARAEGMKKRADSLTAKIAAAEKAVDDALAQLARTDVKQAPGKAAAIKGFNKETGEAKQALDRAEAELAGIEAKKTANALLVSKGKITKEDGANKLAQIQAREKELRQEIKGLDKDLDPKRLMSEYTSVVRDGENSDKHSVLSFMAQDVSETLTKALNKIYESKGSVRVQKARFEAAEKLTAQFVKQINDAESFKDADKLARELHQQLKRIIPERDVTKSVKEASEAHDILDSWTNALDQLNKHTVAQITGKAKSLENQAQKAMQRLQEADPESWGAEGIAGWIRRLVKSGRLPDPVGPDSVSALDIYRTLGLRLPDTFDDVVTLATQAIPKELAEVAQRTVELTKEPGKFWKTYDELTRWMKASVTVLFPAFHGRNAIENTYKSTIHGNVNLKNYQDSARFLVEAVRGIENAPKWIDNALHSMNRKAKDKLGPMSSDLVKMFDELGIGKNMEETIDWFKAHGLLENRITSEFGEVLNDGARGANTADRIKGTLGGMLKAVSVEGTVLKKGLQAAGMTDDFYRMSMFFDRIRKGFSAEEAAQASLEVFFDYKNLTNFERTWARRGAFFYTFAKNNLRYIVEESFRHPQLTKQVAKFFQDDPDNPRHDWLSSMGSFTAGANEVALGFLPQQGFTAFSMGEGDIWDKLNGKFRDLVNRGNPIFPNMAELLFNKDLFTDQPIVREGGTPQEWTFAPPELQKALGVERMADGRYQLPNFWTVAFSVLPPLRRFATTSGAFGDDDRTFWSALLKNTTGINVKARDFNKEDLILLDKNLMRSKRNLDLVVRDGHGQYRANGNRLQGRVLSALYFPSAEKMQDLSLDPEVAAVAFPYMTLNEKGNVEMTGILRQKLRDLALQRFPKEAAFFDTVKIRKGLVDRVQADNEEKDLLKELAAKGFEAEAKNFKTSGELTLDALLSGG